jgi:hypothetical protein
MRRNGAAFKGAGVRGPVSLAGAEAFGLGFAGARRARGRSRIMPDDPKQTLLQSDLEFVRVLEDVISVLIEKNIIAHTELPEAARDKLLRRRDLRVKLKGFNHLIHDDDHGD